LGVSILFGVGSGLYELVLPYYLEERGLSYPKMGWLFAVSTGAMFAIRLASGRLADVWGCKRPYVWAVIGNGTATVLTALTGNVVVLTLLKTGREVALLLRETVHPILLYVEDKGRFRDTIGKTRGLEYLFLAGGTALAGVSMRFWGNGSSLVLGGLILLVAGGLLQIGLRDRPAAREGAAERGAWWRWDLAPNLKVITVSTFLFNMGLTTSHSFIMPLFFSRKFDASAQVVSVIMVLHRLTLALPMLVAGRLPFRNLKAAYLLTLASEGVFISAGGLLPWFLPAAAVWLLHDLVGAGVWIPIQNEIIQRHCREAVRGLDLSKTLALSSVGGAFGPLLAGQVADYSISAPFIISGVLVFLGALVLFRLRLEPEPRAGS
jgi:MFS family permease